MRAELRAEYERKLDEAKQQLIEKYESQIAAFRKRITTKKTLELTSDEDEADDDFEGMELLLP